MKRWLLLLFLFLFFRTISNASIFYSQGSLAPELTVSWNDARTGGGNSPLNFSSGDVFVVQAGHSMVNYANWSVSGSGSKLWIENGGSITANFLVTLSKSTTFTMDDGGIFVHNNLGAPSSTIFNGTENFSPGSTFHITNWIGNLYVIPFGITWGNLIIDVPSLSGSWNQSGNVFNVKGTLDIRETGGGSNEFRLCSRTGMSYTFNIANIRVSGGILNIQGGGTTGTPTMNTIVSGDITVSGGKLDLGTNGTSTVELVGNLSASSTGALRCSGSASTIIFNGTGTHSVYLPAEGMSTNLINVYISSGTIVNMNSAWELNPLSTLNLYGTLNTNNFTLKPRALNVGGTLNMGTSNLEQVGTAAITVGGPSAGNTGVINCGGTITMSATSFSSFLIQPGGSVNLDGGIINMNHSGAVCFVDSGGTLNCGTGKIASINSTLSTFILNPGGNLSIGSPEGITLNGPIGNIQVGGSRSYHTGATYCYKGSVPQVTGNGLPDIINHLKINNGSGVSLSGNVQVDDSLTISNAARLIIPGGIELTVNGPTILNGIDCLDIKSDGSFIDNGTPSSGLGTAIAERSMTGNAWHLISSPVQGSLTGIFLGDYIKPYVEGTLAFGQTISSPYELLNPMQGYSVWPVSNQTILFGGGKLNSGDMETTVTRSYTGQSGVNEYDGWNLVGNPYACSIDLDIAHELWENVEETAYFWDQSSDSGGNYTAYPAVAGFGTHSQFVPPMQGFFVKCNANATSLLPGTGSVRVNNGSKVHASEAFLKENKRICNALYISASGSENSFSDKLVIHFDSNATSGYDPGYDAIKLWGLNEAPQISTLIEENTELTINSLPFDRSTVDIPMRFRAGIPGSYVLKFDSISTFGDSISIVLEDLEKSIFLDVKSIPEYPFTYNQNDDPGRFLIHFINHRLDAGPGRKKQPVQIYSQDGKIGILSTSSEIMTGKLKLYDLTGREVYSFSFENQKKMIVDPRLRSGCYILNMTSNVGIFNRKIYLK